MSNKYCKKPKAVVTTSMNSVTSRAVGRHDVRQFNYSAILKANEIAQFPVNKTTAVSSTVQTAVSPAQLQLQWGSHLNCFLFSSLFLTSLVQRDLIRIQSLFLPYCFFSYYQQIGLTRKEETSKMLHLEHSFIR